MANLNRVTLIGRLGKDAEVVQAGQHQIAKLSIAIDRYDRERNKKTDWVDVTLWSPGKVAPYLVKGKLVYLEGRITKRSWEKDGQKRYAQEVACNHVQLLSKDDGTPALRPSGQAEASTPAPQPSQSNPQGYYPGDDDLPF